MNKRFRFVVTLTLVFMFTLSFMQFLGCKKNSVRKWDNLSIANFSEYRALGAGCVDSTAQKGDNSLYVAYAEGKDDAGEVKLVGITGTNECEEITFVNEEGEITKQNARLIWFDAYSRYSFACFSTDNDAEYVSEKKLVRDWDYYCLSYRIWRNKSGMVSVDYGYDFNNRVSFCGYFFIVDNLTGKIYDVYKVLEKVVSEIDAYSISFINMENDFDYITCSNERSVNDGYVHELYCINFKDTSLEVERKMDTTQLNNFTEGAGINHYSENGLGCFANDKFGNIFQRAIVNSNGGIEIITSFKDGAKYQKASGLFATLSLENDEECFLAINGVVYKTKYANPIGTDNNTPIKRWYLNENSEFVEINNLEKIMNAYESNSCEKDLLKTSDTTYRLIFNQESEWLDEQTYYYYSLILQSCTMVGLDDLNITNKEQVVYSKTYLSQDNYSEWRDSVEEFVLFNGILIGKIGNEILTININNGNSENLFNDYDIKDYFYSKQLDCLKFTAIDKTTLLEVEGFYNKDGEVTVGEFLTDIASLKKVYSIAPLN